MPVFGRKILINLFSALTPTNVDLELSLYLVYASYFGFIVAESASHDVFALLPVFNRVLSGQFTSSKRRE